MSVTNKKRIPTRTLTILGILTALEAIIAFTPLGSLPIGPVVATLAHIPVILAGVTLGLSAGAYMGAVFGLLSFIVFTFIPQPVSFIFTPFYSVGEFSGNAWSLVIVFVPRILLGVLAGLLVKVIEKADRSKLLAYTFAAAVSSLLHTLLVLFGIYFFFGPEFAKLNTWAYESLLGLLFAGIVFPNGIAEAILAVVLVVPIAKALERVSKRGA